MNRKPARLVAATLIAVLSVLGVSQATSAGTPSARTGTWCC